MAPDELEIVLLDPETEVTGTTLAGLWGVTTRTVTDLAKRGIVVRSSRGRYRLLASSVNYAAHEREQAAGRRGGDDDLDLATERALLAREQRRGQQQRNDERDGLLVPIEAVTQQVAREYAVVRERLLGLAGKLGAELTPEQVAKVDAEVREALEELSADAEFAEGGGGPRGEPEPDPEDPEAAA